MSEHAWVLENVACFLADGLDSNERERFEMHVAECADCRKALVDARELEHDLQNLFSPVRPRSDLEDRMIRALDLRARSRLRPRGRTVKVVLAIAAVVLVAVIGGGVTAAVEEGEIGWFSFLESRTTASNQLVTRNDLPLERFRPGTVLSTDSSKRVPDVLGTDWGDGPSVADEGKKLHDLQGKSEISFFSPSYFRPEDTFRKRGDNAKRPVQNAAGQGPGAGFGMGAQEAFSIKGPDPKVMEDALLAKQREKDQVAMAQPSPPAPEGTRKIIRSGDIEFEVDSFDAAAAIVTLLVERTKGSFVATVNSEKLPNGKVRGSIVVRVPPDRLDTFLLDLRKQLSKTGELKGQRIGSLDITKQYTDLESRLRAARTMEERLLKIIKEGKGQIKDLLQAEKELGVWRTRIEEMEGELRYYASQVALSTLTIKLQEKEIRAAAAITESERVRTGIEVDDVEKAMRDTLDAVRAARGRVTRSEMKQHGAGQFNALLDFEVAPDKADLIRDRLRQLGHMARLEIDRVQQTEGGAKAPADAKVQRGETKFFVSLYNLFNMSPRENIAVTAAVVDVPAAYAGLRVYLAKSQGRVANAYLREPDRQNVMATLEFDIVRGAEAGIQKMLSENGEILSRYVTRAAAGENVTDAKVHYRIDLIQADNIPPRETIKLVLEVADVDAALAVFNAQVKEKQGRSQAPMTTQESNGQVTANAAYLVPLAAAPGLVESIKRMGVVRINQSTPNLKTHEGKLALARLEVTFTNSQLLVPRDESLWSQVRKGLSVSLRGLSASVSALIVGVLFILPWLLLLGTIFWLTRKWLARAKRGMKVDA
jgi:hypothetical protein